jgi:phospholipase C
MDSRRDFLKKASLLGGASFIGMLPPAIQKAMAINPATGSTYLDAEHIVFLMQENRSFDHAYGTLQGVRGFNDPRAIRLPNNNKVWLQTNKEGQTYAPFRLDIHGSKATWMSSLPHSWTNQVDARNEGRYDKWLDFKSSGAKAYSAMPLTLGYYNRQDIPFYYAMADAFTVCDHNFCSSLTGTTPNRLYFWTGTIRDKQVAAAQANVWNEDADPDKIVKWKTFPERLEESGVSWKMYQNELYVDVGFEGEEESWLSNYGDNPIEYFEQYKVKMSAAFIANLPKAQKKLEDYINEQKEGLDKNKDNAAELTKIQKNITRAQRSLEQNKQDQIEYTRENYNQLPQWQKSIHEKAFTTNIGDPNYHQLTTLEYDDNGIKRAVQVPKGDLLYQFRKDVETGQLPTVSWITAPENFSDHPSAAWYGSWYISEVLDILTKNPEVWKKTIFVLTYDENDGYFDHLPPFVAPDPNNPDTGAVSKGIDTGLEFVTKEQQSYQDHHNRVSPIGLGYRVPMIIASPWSRGGWVNSQVFDHTSSLQFLEHFLLKKTGKPIVEANISLWRRTVCGNLTSAFRPYNGEKIDFPKPVEREPFIEGIHKAKFKDLPKGFKQLSETEIQLANSNSAAASFLPSQEKGTRPSSALPYELYVNGQLSADKKTFSIECKVGNDVLGKNAWGSPFNIYAHNLTAPEQVKTQSLAIVPGDSLQRQWKIEDFNNGQYLLRVYGPNGYFREFSGTANDAALHVSCSYEWQPNSKKLTGKIQLQLKNEGSASITVNIVDHSYGAKTVAKAIRPGASEKLVFDVSKSFGWYDLAVQVPGIKGFEKRFAGRIETGKPSQSDPAMA